MDEYTTRNLISISILISNHILVYVLILKKINNKSYSFWVASFQIAVTHDVKLEYIKWSASERIRECRQKNTY